MGVVGKAYNKRGFLMEAFRFSIYVCGPIGMTWYASKPENMNKCRQYLDYVFNIKMVVAPDARIKPPSVKKEEIDQAEQMFKSIEPKEEEEEN